MKILSWNIDGLISWIENQSYRDIEDLDADVICFQETRTKRRLTALSNYCHYWNPCERDGMHGTMTLSKQEPLNVMYGLGVENLDKEGKSFDNRTSDAFCCELLRTTSSKFRTS